MRPTHAKAGETRRLHPVPQNANRRSLVLAMYLPTMHQQFEMAAADVSPVLRCSLCNKPFGKLSTLKRHSYYCRSRQGGSVTRMRSCSSCVKTKTRCDNGRPACARCTIKDLDCQYPAKAAPPSDSRTTAQRGSDVPLKESSFPRDCQVVSELLAADNTLNNKNNGAGSMHDAFFPQDLGIQGNGAGSNAWGGIDWQSLVPAQMSFDTTQYHDSMSPTTMMHSGTPSSDDSSALQRAIFRPKSQVLTMPSFTQPSILLRQHTDIASQRVSHLMLQTLQSYPLMMLRQRAPPPFAHPRLIASPLNDDMEPWYNCMSLVHLMQGGIQGSRKLFWRNVRMECERFCSLHFQLNKWELLAAMQALAIYVIIRLGEGDTDLYNIDAVLLRAVTAISTSLMTVDTTPSSTPSDKLSLDTSWKNWIMEESRRRLCVLFQIVNMVVHFEPAAKCETGGNIVLAPLPAQKLIWEASDEYAWKLKCETEPEAQREFGLARNGQLVRIDEDAASGNPRGPLDTMAISNTTAKWNEWCSGMDGIGGLVMLAASLIQ